MDPSDAMMETLADFLDQPVFPAALRGHGIPTLDDLMDSRPVVRGWENQDRRLLYPTLIIDNPVAGTRTNSSPKVIERGLNNPAPTDPSEVVLVSVGNLELPLQLTVKADSRHQRALMVNALETHLAAGIASGVGCLAIEAPAYFGRKIGYRREGGVRDLDTAGSVGGDEWQAVVEVVADASILHPLTVNRFLSLELQLQVFEPGMEDVTPIETIAVFDLT